MKNSICNKKTTIKEILLFINADPAGIAFIVNDNSILCGLITDGDIRRLLISGRELDSYLVENDYSNYVYAIEGQPIEKLLNEVDKKVRIIPIISKDGKLIDYFRYEHKTHFTPVAEPSLKGNELKYVTDALLSTWISSKGIYLDRFEKEFSTFCDTNYGVATSNGTVSIHLALKALEIGEGDEVIVPDLTFAATINPVILSGAKPVIVDIDKNSWTICPKKIKKAISSKTKAIIPVHVYGQPCDMDSIMKIANEHNLYVIEDCAEAHGATFKNKKVGSFGDISTFSFFGNKIITTGEGGMCVTNSEKLFNKMKVLRDHGMDPKKRYWHKEIGFNYRMTNLQAAIGCAQLEKINSILESHKKIEDNYKNELNDSNLEWQYNSEKANRVVWLVSLLIPADKRDLLIAQLQTKNIDARRFFYCLSEMPLYEKYALDCNISKEISSRGINLPTIEDIDYKLIRGIVEDCINS
ncbi:MAG: aminotransferase DegT [Crocinitomicaceae bacterium]|nr:aminotransferase DegT [Crocinitomicaceae bacterium]